eukprot:4833318-Prymnesium_polylepis.1
MGADAKCDDSVTHFDRLSAAVKLFAMKEVGDHPLADLQEETMQTMTNIGLVSALMLTMAVPNFFDASQSPQTNAYIATNPAWIGEVYFVTNHVQFVCFLFATLSSVLW